MGFNTGMNDTTKTIRTRGRLISKLFNVRGSIHYGQIRMRLVRDGAAVAIYGQDFDLNGYPHIISGTTEQLRAACDKIKADYQLTEVK